jgi:hypothetical protein
LLSPLSPELYLRTQAACPEGRLNGCRRTLLYPFIDRQGNPERSHMIQLLGETEKARILDDEQTLIDDRSGH